MNLLEFSFLYFYHMDFANACIHLAKVKFSPITFELAEILGGESAEVLDVFSHKGLYEQDKGR